MESVSHDEQLFQNKLEITIITGIDDDQINNNELRNIDETEIDVPCPQKIIFHIFCNMWQFA